MSNNDQEVIDLTEVSDEESFVHPVDIRDSRSLRSWCGTFNNYTEEQRTEFIRKIEELGVTRAIVAREVGEENETPHLQWCFTLRSPTRFNSLRMILQGAHIEAVRNLPAAFEYCEKEDNNPWTVDNRRQGARTDLDKVVQSITEGMPMDEVARAHPKEFIKYPNGIQKYHLIHNNKFRPMDWARVKYSWFYGPTGSGKTYMAVKQCLEQGKTFWIANIEDSNGFWNGYHQQDVIIFDDIRKDCMKFHTWLRVLDITPITVNVKNLADCRLASTEIIITAPKDPYDMWDNHQEDIGQLIRRLNGGIHRFKNDRTIDSHVEEELRNKYKLPPAAVAAGFRLARQDVETQETISVNSDDDDDIVAGTQPNGPGTPHNIIRKVPNAPVKRRKI